MNQNLELISNSAIHDYELNEISINYVKNNVKLIISLYPEQIQIIQIDNFINFEISHNEPWGTGKYINYSEIDYTSNKESYFISIELNSGDIIKIQCQKK